MRSSAYPDVPAFLVDDVDQHLGRVRGTRRDVAPQVVEDLLGQRLAGPGVTVVDDGTIPDRRGSLTVDDEGTPSNRTVLIEDGVLVGYMQDRQNARLMGVKPTGNPLTDVNVMRPDVVMPGLTQDQALAAAPKAVDGRFAVPRILGEPE